MKYVSIFLIAILCFYAVAHAEITRTLSVGSRGADVRELQVFLNSDPDTRIATNGPGSPGNESTYFGALTAKAVSRLQIKYAVDALVPAGLSAPTGIVGYFTRTLIYKLRWQDTPAPVLVAPASTSVSITTINPTIITSSPQSITIQGTGFTPFNNTVVVASDGTQGVGSYASSDGTTLTFPFTFATAEKMRSQLLQYKYSGRYTAILSSFVSNLTGETVTHVNGTTYIRTILKVTNANGESNAVPIEVDIQKILQ